MKRPNLTESTQLALDDFRSDTRFAHSNNGAESAWRGYSLQTLYICKRVSDGELDSVFLPETVEDLAIIHNAGDKDREYVELIQVKSSNSYALSFSKLETKREDSFFKRILNIWGKVERLSARVVMFGAIGPELKNAHENFGADGTLRKKLIQEGYCTEFCDWARDNLLFEVAKESELEGLLRKAFCMSVETAAAVDLARDYAMAHIASCCRFSRPITAESWKSLLNAFATQAASARGFLGHYGTTIVPLAEYLVDTPESIQAVEQAYRSGASATPLHILLGLDIRRDRWIHALDDALANSNVAVVRAASGQGKSTLCYRWLFERKSVQDVYLINGVSVENAPDIAAAFRGLAKGGDCIAYIEADSDKGWVSLCREISRVGTQKLKLLVSVREDDAARAGYNAFRVGATDVLLRIDEKEALELYDLSGSRLFPSFGAAWKAFGGEGPLMEFVFSLNHEMRLREKLEEQIDLLRTQGDESWLTFLYLASRAGEIGLSASISDLKKASGCSNTQSMLQVFENELLLRSDMQRGVVMPLHPYRSKLLVEIIREILYEEEERLVIDAACCTCGDFGPILVSYYAKHTMSESGMDALLQIAEKSWSCARYVLQAMVWKDARRYYLSTTDIRDKMAEMGLAYVGAMISGAAIAKPISDDWKVFLDLMPRERREIFEPLVLELIERRADFKITNRFLTSLAASPPPVAECTIAPYDAGFVLAYIGSHGLADLIPDAVIQQLIHVDLVGIESLEGTLDLLVGLDCVGASVSEEARNQVLMKVCRRDNIVWIDVEETIPTSVLSTAKEPYGEIPAECLDANGMVRQVNAITVPPIDEDSRSDRTPSEITPLTSPNEVTMRSICDLRRVLPNRGRYCVRYVGIRALAGGIEVPDCKKHIPEKNLQLNWLKLINQYYLAMCKLDDDLPQDWRQLEESLQTAVNDAMIALEACSDLLDAFFQGTRKLKGKQQKAFNACIEAKNALDSLNIEIPLCSQDPYGFISKEPETFSGLNQADAQDREIKRAFGVPQNSAGILSATRRFVLDLSCHFNNAFDMIMYACGSEKRPERIAVFNLVKACDDLIACNKEFVALFSGAPLLNSVRTRQLLQHAAFWNLIWNKRPSNKKQTYRSQEKRVKKLLTFPDRLVKRLLKEHAVINAGYDDSGVISVFYMADAGEPFVRLVSRCIDDSLRIDLSSDKYFFEMWLLRATVTPRFEISYMLNEKSLVKASCPFCVFIDSPGDFEKAEKLTQTELAFDVDSIVDANQAFLSIQTEITTLERLIECSAEINACIEQADSSGEYAASAELQRWRMNVTETIDQLCNHLKYDFALLSDAPEEHMSMADDIQLRLHSAMTKSDVTGEVALLETFR